MMRVHESLPITLLTVDAFTLFKFILCKRSEICRAVSPPNNGRSGLFVTYKVFGGNPPRHLLYDGGFPCTDPALPGEDLSGCPNGACWPIVKRGVALTLRRVLLKKRETTSGVI